MDCIWQQHLEQRLKYERSLNFSTLPESEDDFNCAKKKVSRDPMSHRIIEKRRRDRMNNCLADLSRLIPSNYLKKGRGRIEKTEIIEMAIKHLKQLQAHKCGAAATADVVNGADRNGDRGIAAESLDVEATNSSDNLEQYRLGYQECLSETMHFLVELEGLYPGDSLCIRLMNHLQKHCGRIVNGLGRHRMADHQDGFGARMMAVLNHQEAGCLADRSASPSSVSRPLSQCPSDRESPQSPPPPSSSSSSNCNMLDVGIKVESKEPSIESTCLVVTNGHHVDDVHGGSQLREMLQNPSTLTTTTTTSSANPVASMNTAAVASGGGGGGGLQRGRSLSLSSSRPVSTTSSSGSSLGRGDEVYKFKRNIKERFKADQQVGRIESLNGCHDNHHYYHHHHHHHHHGVDDDGAGPDVDPQMMMIQDDENMHRRPETPENLTSERKYSADLLKSDVRESSTTTTTTTRKRRPTSPETISEVPTSRYASSASKVIATGAKIYRSTEPASPIPPTSSTRKSSYGGVGVGGQTADVPIFALHPKGEYYVPMSVDASLIVPYMMLHRHVASSSNCDGGDVNETVLHHVGITVYFRNGTAKIPSVHRILQDTMSMSAVRPPSASNCNGTNGFA